MLHLTFDYNWLKDKVLEMKSDWKFDTHMFTISEQDGTLIHGWLFEPRNNRIDGYNY